MLPALAVVRRYVLPGQVGMIILSAIAADTGWHWMLDRGGALWATRWPQPTMAGLTILAVWIACIFVAAGGINILTRRLTNIGQGAALPSPQRWLAD
jgi:hypothetical protein